MTPIDWRYCHKPSGSGLSQTNFGNVQVKRCSQTAPASSLSYSPEPLALRISCGLMVASPTKISLVPGGYLRRTSKLGKRSAWRRRLFFFWLLFLLFWFFLFSWFLFSVLVVVFCFL